MFPSSSVSKDKQELINHARNAREIRQHEKCKSDAAVKIQKVLRSWLARRRLYRQTSSEFDTLFKEDIKSISAVEAYKTARQFLRFCDRKKDEDRFQTYCRYLVSSLEQDSPKISCIGVALGKEFALSWISHIKFVLELCLQHLEQINLETSHDAKPMTLYLHTLVSFTATNTWAIVNLGKLPEALKNGMQQICNNIMGHLVTKNYYAVMKTLLVRGLCRQRSHLKHAAVSAVLTLCLRPVIAADFSSRLISLFILHILSVPSLMTQLQTIAPEIVTLFKKHGLLQRVLDFLTVDQNIKIVFHTLEAGLAICLLANVIHLAKVEDEEILKNLVYPQLVCVVQRLLEHCQRYVASKQSNLTQWHPILGWFSCAEKSDVLAATREVIPLVKQQLALLWTGPLISYLFECLPADEEPFPENLEDKNLVSAFKRALGNQKQTVPKPQSRSYRKLGSPEVTQVAFVCTAYQTALTTLSQMRMDILTALSCRTGILPNLWYFVSSLGPNCGLKTFIEFLNVDSKAATPECKMLQMFCEISTHLVTVLDDIEMYEDQRPFKLADLLSITNFLNHFIFRAIWNGLIDSETLNNSSVLSQGTSNLYAAAHTLLMVLHRRDCRRPFATPDHWLVKDVKTSVVMTELDRGKKNAQLLLQKMPHVIPLEERVVLFRRYITNEKKSLGLTESVSASPQSILITVHRSRVVEDSFRQLADLPPLIWKGIIRVKFINIQGLDEAGIDQDGVFKEFLEETIRRLFDPSLNLFRTTKDQRLYPSPTSYLTDNHLMLFEFAGKLLGKAVYEGITVDVPLASFFLSQVLGHCHSALYSAIDELPSLDPELYRNLTYIKRHNGDVSELSLTFSVDDDCMGHLETHELRPGGRAIPVTNENKISYIHEMAHFRMHTQIRDQTAAFSRGFRSLINLEWLSLFSTPEVQRLIADDKGPIDVKDLRRNTKYYGGFHDNHRVISWLWDILESDFNEEERKLFLKFVTSCSKPPLLGFAHLQPPFSIRCVEVGDDEDHGDTIGSVIRGFFTIRKRDPVNRLPTSSTCFNLLKLPNYQKRSTLKEKLRYAITSNTGFELS